MSNILPVFVAGEKKLNTGEKMVPSRVVRGGLLASSTGASSFPFGFIGLLFSDNVSKDMINIYLKSENYNWITHFLNPHIHYANYSKNIYIFDTVPLLGLFLQTLETALLERPRVCGVEVIRLLSALQSIRLLLAGISCST